MSSFTPEQKDEMRRLFDRWSDDSRSSTLIRQLQGGLERTSTQILGDMTTASTTYVPLANGPELTISTAANYDVTPAIQFVQVAGGVNNMNATVLKNGVDLLIGLNLSGQAFGDGATIQRTFGPHAFEVGDVLSIAVLTANAVSTRFVNASLSITRVQG